MKVIIWGYPFGSHTHSYIHDGYYRAFKYLGYDTYWFDDNNHPINFDYNNCLFITEGFADKKIPILETSTYCVMYCPDPSKYEKAKKYIDVRSSAINFKDHIYEYSIDNGRCQQIGPTCYYEPATNGTIQFKNSHVHKEMKDFDKFYLGWCTNLLPHEINLDWRFKTRENAIYFCGTLSDSGICENMSNWRDFIKTCQENGIQFKHNCPWQRSLSTEQVINYTQRSYMMPDIRGPEHIRTGIITCRLFKSISYGQLGLTNSKAMYEAMGKLAIYDHNPIILFRKGIEELKNYNLIAEQMEYVRHHHTYINRIHSLLSIL